MHNVEEGKLIKLARLTVIISCINEFEIPELVNSKTNPPENHQDNGATSPVNTQTSPPQSHLVTLIPT